MSETPAVRHAALASASRAGSALIGPGGWINFATGTDGTLADVGDFPDSDVEVAGLAVLDGPDVHPTKMRDVTVRMAPMPHEREAGGLQPLI
jgi:hypothetical protein